MWASLHVSAWLLGHTTSRDMVIQPIRAVSVPGIQVKVVNSYEAASLKVPVSLFNKVLCDTATMDVLDNNVTQTTMDVLVTMRSEVHRQRQQDIASVTAPSTRWICWHRPCATVFVRRSEQIEETHLSNRRESDETNTSISWLGDVEPFTRWTTAPRGHQHLPTYQHMRPGRRHVSSCNGSLGWF